VGSRNHEVSVVGITKILFRELCGHPSRLDFRRILRISVSQVMQQVPEAEEKRIPAEMQHVREFMQDEFDSGSVRGVYWAMFHPQIHPVCQGQSRHVPVSRNPLEGNACARVKSNPAWVTEELRVSADIR
jgi:hypothetical protein